MISETYRTEIDNVKDLYVVMQCTTGWNIVIAIQKHLEIYGNIVKMKQIIIPKHVQISLNQNWQTVSLMQVLVMQK